MLRFSAISAPRVTVVVVSAKAPERLLACLAAVAAETERVDLEVVVVANGAAPEFADAVRAGVGGVELVVSGVPLGFAGGVNLGAAQARGRYLHVLHDDAVVEPGAIQALADTLDAEPRAGAAGSLLLHAGDGAVQGAGYVLWRDGRTQPPWSGPPPPPETFDVTRPVDYCASASVMVRADVWRAIGGLDDELHPGQFVDVDLAMRVRAAGYVVLCAPRSVVRHARGGSASAAVRRVAWQRNRARFLATWEHDLRAQEPFADDPEALARAAEATRRRAEQVLASPPAPAPRAALPVVPAPEREHRALLRDLAFKDACVQELGRVDEAADGLRADVAARDAELHRVHTAHAAEMSARIAAESALDELRRELHARDDRLAYLEHRSSVLEGIVTGRWWRLRQRLRFGRS